ncbi:MAG: EAL domain-containing protein [Gammaproteobacteria bacterium]|nr:EAL domain-containing protein [Gammaproteobacteria bacterium]
MIHSPLTILLVEDSPVDARVLQVLLEKASGGLCRVMHADSLATSLQHLEHDAVDVIVLDLGLADSWGLATFDAFQARAPLIPVVVLTGMDDQELALRAMQSGAQDYLIKDRLKGDTVLRSVRYAVERSRLLRAEQAGHAAARAAERRIRDLLESVDAILWEMDFSTWTYSFVSKRAEDILGYPVAEWLDTPGFLLAHLHPDDRDRLLATSHELVAGSAKSFEVRVFAADGRVVWLLGSIMHGRRDTGVSAGMLVDITARKLLELLEREQSEILAMVAQSLPVDAVLSRITALVENQCPGSCVCAVAFQDALLAWCVGPGVPADFLAALQRSCFPLLMATRPATGALLGGDAWHSCRELAAGYGLTLADCVPIVSAQGELRGALLVCHETGEPPPVLNAVVLNAAGRLAELLLAHSTLELQLSHQANHDALTGLPNRALFNDRLEQSLLRAEREQRQVAVVFIDLDGFKRINDTLGHGAGDELLCMATSRFKSLIRRSDTLARMGGDEFMLVLNSIARSQDAVRMGQLLLESLAAPFQLQGHEIHVSASIGISFYPDDATEPALLQAHADAAMYQAKASGRNCFRCYTPELNRQLTERILLEEDLRHAVARGQIVLHYQPLYRADAQLLGFEALVRWQHPVHGMISPERFIPIAEESKLIHEIGRWVLEQACGECVRWHEAGYPDLHVAVNVSALQFQHDEWLGVLALTLAHTGLAPGSLELELTEGVLLQQTDSITLLRAIKNLGVAIAIDDFGTGYSSLAYLQRLPVDTLKIDQSFIRNLHMQRSEQGSMLIVEAIITLARGLGLRVLAEGVETKWQWDCLCRMGCDAMQGFYFGRPVSAEQCWALLAPEERALGVA